MDKLSYPDPARPGTGPGPAAGEPSGDGGEEGAAAGPEGFGRACIGRWLPAEYSDELYKVVRLSGPLLSCRILNFLLKFTTSVFCGRIGNTELAGYALASATINLTTAATGVGLGVACDTLVSQVFGSKNLKHVGVILQRSMLILLLFCLPCWALLSNSYNILLLLHQKEEVARISHLYVMTFLPAIPAMFLYQLEVSYLQNQGIILPQMYTAAAANIFNVVANYVLIFSFQLGVVGSAVANSLHEIVICLLLFGYIKWKKLHVTTWGGWSMECLQDWGSYMKLALPSAFMICFEWWVWEIGGFLAGILGKLDLAAQHIIVEIGGITYLIPLGIHGAACVCIGNALGAGNTKQALVVCKVVLVLAGVILVAQGIILVCSKSVLGFIFTTDKDILAMVSEILSVYTFVQFFDGLLCVFTGIFIGSGLQFVVALAHLLSYIVGLPVGVALMFYTNLRVQGLWLGLLISVFIETCIFLVLTYKLDWKKITRKAQARTGKKVMAAPKRSVSVNEELVPDIDTHQNTDLSTLKASVDGVEEPTVNGYKLVNPQEQKVDKSSQHPMLLSPTQLVLRRGLTLLVSVLILAIGVTVYLVFPVPKPTIQSGTNGTLIQGYNSTSSPLTLMDFTLNP